MRTWFQAAFFALTNGYARGYTSGKIFTGGTKILCVPGLNCYSCPGAVGACPIGSLQAVLNKSSFKVSLYVFGLISMFGVLFGRLVCGWMCPFGLVQDLLHKIKLGPKHKNLPGHQYLRYLRFAILAILVLLLPAVAISATGVGHPWFCEWICPSGTLLGGIPLVILNDSFRSAIGLRFAWKMLILIALLLCSVVYYRPFCKYLCPLGALYGLFNPVSTYRLEVDANKCVSCRACQRACGMDIATFQTPNSMDCIRCGDCLRACPTGALSSTWGTMRTNVASRCIVDDEVASTASASSTNRELALTTMLGIIMTVGGLCSFIMSVALNVYQDIYVRFSVEEMANVHHGSVLFGATKVAASLIIFMAGIYLLYKRNNVDVVKGVSEKLRIAHHVYFFGLVVLMISIVIDLHTLAGLLTPLLANFFCLLGIPFIRGAATGINQRLEGKSAKQTPVMMVFAAIVTIGELILTISLLSSLF